MRKRNWDRWVILISAILSMITSLKGWIGKGSMQTIIGFWNNLDPWRFLAYAFFLICLMSLIHYILGWSRDISKRLEHLEKDLEHGPSNGHLIKDPARKKKDEFLKRLLTGSH